MIRTQMKLSRPANVALVTTCLVLVFAVTAFFLHLSANISDNNSGFLPHHEPRPGDLGLDTCNESSESHKCKPSNFNNSTKPLSSPAPSIATASSTPAPLNISFDALHYRMTSNQCSVAFGALYADLHRAAEHRRKKGNITPDDIDLGWRGNRGVRAMIYKDQLYILNAQFSDSGHDSTRSLAILHQLNRALTASPEPLPDIEFSISANDITDHEHAHHTIWALTRRVDDENMWLMPDFGYWSWPLDLVGGYEQIRMEIEANEPAWDDKVAKLFWRGAEAQNEVRTYLKKETKGKEWADVQEVGWKNRTQVSAGSKTTATSIVDHCDYQFLAQTEGKSYSGRGKYLFNCNSVVVMHKPEWVEPHHSLLIPSGPDQNVVMVERDFSDLDAKMTELLRDRAKTRNIASHSAKIFRDRHLTPAAQACYWREMIRVWSGVSFKPEHWKVVDGKKRLRGVPFETFAIEALVPGDKQCSIWQKIFG